MGSRSKIAKEIDIAYIAGFLDGDGSLMLQIKKRKDGNIGIRFMPTICFYQDTRHEKTLYWIQEVLGIGYLSKRNDGMTELRINGYKQVRDILNILLPYIRFKKLQGDALKNACEILSDTKFKMLSKEKLKELVNYILVIQGENYVTKKKKTREEFLAMLGLTP
ncbi:hypothetical protein KGQ29_04655 [Patescibacteria group bacterium]|nr:hypothetical protein [Patescibacteria group bacterium]